VAWRLKRSAVLSVYSNAAGCWTFKLVSRGNFQPVAVVITSCIMTQSLCPRSVCGIIGDNTSRALELRRNVHGKKKFILFHLVTELSVEHSDMG
jgi:hypothetical protein